MRFFIWPLVSVICFDLSESQKAKDLCLHNHLYQLNMKFFESNLAQGLWTWSQSCAISIRNSTEGRQVFEMHKVPGDIIENFLLPKLCL